MDECPQRVGQDAALVGRYVYMFVFFTFDSCEIDSAQQMKSREEQEKSRTAGSP